MRSDPFSGRYLFHLHTSYTDGRVSVREYFELAAARRLDRLLFLEHIRAEPRYDVRQFAEEVGECSAAFGVPALVGFEAKLLPGGALDVAEEHAAMAEVIGLAEHGFPADYALWHASLRQALQTYAGRWRDKHLVWVHPGLWLKRQGLLETHEQEYRELIGLAQALGIKIERNRRYGLLPSQILDAVHPGSLVCGADAHCREDAEAAVAETA